MPVPDKPGFYWWSHGCGRWTVVEVPEEVLEEGGKTRTLSVGNDIGQTINERSNSGKWGPQIKEPK